MASSLSLSWFSIQWYLGDLFDVNFCGVFVGIRWIVSLWSDYPWNYLSLFWSLLCMIIIASYFFSHLLIWFGQLDWFFFPWEEVLCSGFHLAVLNPSDRKGHDTYVLLLLRVKRWVYSYVSLSYLHHVIVLKALLRSYGLNTLDACWIAVDVWSNSSRCRQESVYLIWMWCLYHDHCLG